MTNDARVMIRCERLSKAYGAQMAVRDVSFEVTRGEILGFLGPNGAGKSTTMKILTCFLTPTYGRAEVAGFDVFTDSMEVRRRIGYLPEDTPLYRDMTVLEYLDYVTELRKIPRADRRGRIKTVGEATGILNVLGKRIGELSRGYRQRVGLTQAMVHDPDVLILDEPTSGLDPNQIVEIRQLIQRIGKEKTVVLSTHILPEVQATCGRVLIISDGRLVADGRPDDLVAQEKSNRFRLLLEAGPAPDAVREKLRLIDGIKDIHEVSVEGGMQFTLVTDGARDIRKDLYRCSVDNGWPLLELDRREASLEEVFAKLTRVEAAPAAATERKAA